MTGTPLFAGPLANAQPTAPAPAAPVAAPAATVPAAQPGAGKPMFAGPLAPNQPQATAAASPTESAPQSSGLAEKLSQFGSGAEEGLLGLGDAAQAIVSPGGAGQFATNLIRTIMGGPDLSTSAPVHKMLEDNGLITPPTSDPVDKITRAVGTALGGAVIPEAGMEGLTVDALKGLIPAATSGLAQGTADVVAPDNPLVSTIAGIAGGLAPSTISSSIRAVTSAGKALPSLDELVSSERNADLRAAKEQAYQAVDNSGVRYSPLAYNDLVNKIMDGMADKMNPGLTPKTASFIQTDVAGKPQMYAPTLTQADQLRQQASRSLAKSSDAGESHFGNQIIGHIDDFLNNADPAQMVNGSAPDAANLINNARAANTTYQKAENLDDAIMRARVNAGASGTGGNINNALRQQLKPFLTNDNVGRGLSDAEKQAIAEIIQGSPGENFARLVGRLSPNGNGLMAQMNLLGAILSHGATAVVPAVGAVAKHIGDSGTESRVADLRDMFRGNPPQDRSFFKPAQKSAMAAAMLSAIMRPAGQGSSP